VNALPRPRIPVFGVLLVSLASLSCALTEPVHPPDAAQQRPEDAILNITRHWLARYSERGLRSSPSPIASFDRQLTSRLELNRGMQSASETLDFTERFVLRDGGEVHCSGQVEGDVSVLYGRRSGEPALELSWSTLLAPRKCDAPLVESTFERPAGLSRFVLRADQLVGLGSALDRRTFSPAD
jgi:hypothetical protein